MRALSTRTHGVVDYLLAALLIALPWAFGFVREEAAAWAPVAAGVLLLLYSLGTDYELGVARRLQMPVHLWLDALVGVTLAVSPWVLAFDHRVWAPHLVLGLALLIVAGVSATIPGYERRRGGRAEGG